MHDRFVPVRRRVGRSVDAVAVQLRVSGRVREGERRRRRRSGAAPGVWMSPWGGYGKPKQERVAAGQAAGYEIVGGGFALSGPKYYAAFRDACLRFVREYGVNQFKFDGTGNADRVVPGSEFDSDFAAAIHLIGELRALKPDLYVNLTTGTYPSPFWLRVRRLDLARRRGPRLPRRRLEARAVDHLPRRRRLRARRAAGAALSAEFADAARAHLRPPREGSGYRSAARLPERGARLLRDRHPAAGDVHHAGAALERGLGRAGGGRRHGRARTPTCWSTRTGSAAIRRELEVYGWASWASAQGDSRAAESVRPAADDPRRHREGVRAARRARRARYTLRSPWKDDRQPAGRARRGGTAARVRARSRSKCSCSKVPRL